MTGHRIQYRERTPWAVWLNAIVLVSAIACLNPFLGELTPRNAVIAAIVALIFAVLMAFLAGTTVLLDRAELRVHLGSFPLIQKRMPFGDIASTEVTRYRPIREFGGWGVRGFGKKQAWTARGDQAVILHLVNGNQLYIGSDTPQRLEERIRSTAGDQLGKNG